MATPVKKASAKKMQKGGPSPMNTRMSDTPMTSKEKRKAKSDMKATMKFAKKNPGLKMQAGGTSKSTSMSQSAARKAAIADSTTKFPYTSSSGAVYATRKDLTEGRPTNPAKLKKQKSGGASLTGYKKGGTVAKKQMGGAASKKGIFDRDPLGSNPGSCKSGKCAPGMGGTKGIRRPKSNFGKRKFGKLVG